MESKTSWIRKMHLFEIRSENYPTAYVQGISKAKVQLIAYTDIKSSLE